MALPAGAYRCEAGSNRVLPLVTGGFGRLSGRPAAAIAPMILFHVLELTRDHEVPSETRNLAGWTVHVSKKLLETNVAATTRALALLKAQLEAIVRMVPTAAVTQLQKVPLWISPEYPGVPPRAEYHPDAGWLRGHGRDPAMAKGVEFTNVRIFEPECRRMPMMALHELAHAYHHRVLGYDQPEIQAAFEHAKDGGTYDRVERRDAQGRVRLDRAYALSNPQEYFAENTEAFFGTNDFFPFIRAELKEHDPDHVCATG